MINLKRFLEFNKLLHKFQQVERSVFVPGQNRKENDLEHSAQLALCAWSLISSYNLKLDIAKVLKYALAHDLVEAYAGDTYFYSEDKDAGKKKIEKETAAAKLIASQFPEFTDLHKVIHAYEQRPDEESKFVYALDKVIPVINVYLDNGRTWKVESMTLEILKTKKDKVKVSAEIDYLWDRLVELLESSHSRLFNSR